MDITPTPPSNNLPINVVSLQISGELAVIELGQPQEKAVILSKSRMASFKGALEELKANRAVRYLVIAGSSTSMFCAGADINIIKDVSDTKVGETLAREGQEIFQLLEDLPQKTFAAISGPCVGGGCEMVLACDQRILLNTPSTRIGLPEIKLGILPGFGGTQRLPRLVGLPNALQIILKGKVISANEALRMGLADQVVSPETLVPSSEKGIVDERKLFEYFKTYVAETATGKRQYKSTRTISMRDKFLTFNFIGRAVVRSRTESTVLRDTKGRYPAPVKAIQAIFTGLQYGVERGYLEERKLLGELIASPESKSLVHLFQISELSQKLGKELKEDLSNTKVGVIGGGTMGAGIGAACLLSGVPTTIVEPIEQVRAKARNHVLELLQKKRSLNETKRKELENKFKIQSDAASLTDVNVVIEAIIEDKKAKQTLFAQVEPGLPPNGILATNTSSIPLEQLGESLARPANFVGLHFFNPADKMPLVEVIRSKNTSDITVLRGAAFAAKIGKYPIVVEDVPGFLVNRILTPYLVEASMLLSEGYSVPEIDFAAEDFGMPMGPFKLLDEIGLDVASKVSEIMERAYGERMRGYPFAERLVKKGFLGKKSGRGFYSHQNRTPTPIESIRIDLGLDVGDKNKNFSIGDRLILAMLCEAVRAYDERVAGNPGPDAAGQIDLGTVMGIGFPPYRGGVLWYCQNLGPAKVADKLRVMRGQLGPRFEPPAGLQKGFY